MTNWIETARLYREPRILSIFFLGFSSGLPFLLTLATLQVWLKEAGLTKTVIGLFAFVTIPYSLKFIWAPILEHLHIPYLSSWFGHRKSWMLVTQILVLCALILLGQTNPHHHIALTAAAAFLVAFCSATQDIIIEAYRVGVLPPQEIGVGAGASNLGYRLGMWVSGAGALYLASFLEWSTVYGLMAACMLVGIVTTLLTQNVDAPSVLRVTRKFFRTQLSQVLKQSVRTFKELHQTHQWGVILGVIMCYKLGDTFLNVMSMPFLLEIGFSKIEIAHIGKTFGITAMVFGGVVGGILLYRHALQQCLVIYICLQVVAAVLCALQAHVGNNIFLLIPTIGCENFTCGLGAAVFLTYLSLVSRQHAPITCFAVLTSLASFCRVNFSYAAGWMADRIDWIHYYAFVGLAGMISLVLLSIYWSYFDELVGRVITPKPASA